MERRQRYCTFFVAGELFGLPVGKVQELLRVQKTTLVPLAPNWVHGLLNLRGQVVAVVDLRARFGLPPLDEGTVAMFVVVHSKGELLALLADNVGDVIDVEDTVFEPLPCTLRGSNRSLFERSCKLERRLMTILNLDAIAEASEVDSGAFAGAA
jgi:chemotaxis signal transduction protein